MKDGWLDRIRESVEADGRSLNALSKSAGLGRNFVQQLVKHGKSPGAARLEALLTALGPTAAHYVRTGNRLPAQEAELVHLLSRIPADKLSLVRSMFQAILNDEASQALAPSGDGPSAAKGQ